MASSQSPPALHTPSTRASVERESSIESEPIRTPTSAAGYHYPNRKAHDRELLFSVYARGGHTTQELSSDDLLFPHGDERGDSVVPLFAAASPYTQPTPMAASASPIDIRQSSNSPRNQQSNLTSQFEQPRIDVQHAGDMETERPSDAQYRGRQESVGMLGTTPYGARSIPPREGFRRESNALSGSLMNGMSWGGISVGSFIRDE